MDRSFYRFVTIHACDRRTDGRTDGQTDRQTDRILITIPRLHYMQRGNKPQSRESRRRGGRGVGKGCPGHLPIGDSILAPSALAPIRYFFYKSSTADFEPRKRVSCLFSRAASKKAWPRSTSLPQTRCRQIHQ